MGLFDKLFRNNKRPTSTERVEISSGNNHFTSWSGNAYSNDIYRGAVDAIARNAGKLKGSHILNYIDTKTRPIDNKLNRVLQIEPNPFMNSYDLIYKLVTHYYLYNNAFAYLERDQRGNVVGIYPIRTVAVDFLSDPTETIFCEFTLLNGKKYLLPYADIVHIKRHYNDNDFMGDSNSAINGMLEVSHIQNEGIVNGIKSGVTIRGILKFTSILNDETLKQKRDAFMTDYMQIGNSGGVVATDNAMDYVPIENKPYVIDAEQVKVTRDKIYTYLGVSDKIVNSNYDENEWAAFYESTIEPIALQLSLEFTRKMFTKRERSFGNEILFESGRLQFASNASKVQILKELMPMGLLTINQGLDILNMPSVPDGDRRIQSLNFVDQEHVLDYQLQSPPPVETQDNEGEES